MQPHIFDAFYVTHENNFEKMDWELGYGWPGGWLSCTLGP